MRASLQQLVYHIRGSYWFLPSLMVAFAIALSQMSVRIDREIGAEWLSKFWFASMNQPDGAGTLLATVAGSMITVAGVTFSLTILAVSHATSHFGPRLLDNFIRDRGNQVTLSTFVATSLYCFLVLRVVRGASDSSNTINEEIFILQLSILIALVLTIASVAELIYFIHHVPESIHISTVLQHLSQDTFFALNAFVEVAARALSRQCSESTGCPKGSANFHVDRCLRLGDWTAKAPSASLRPKFPMKISFIQ